jgi:hypothetical protein
MRKLYRPDECGCLVRAVVVADSLVDYRAGHRRRVDCVVDWQTEGPRTGSCRPPVPSVRLGSHIHLPTRAVQRRCHSFVN